MSSGVERCRGVSRGVEVSSLAHLDTDELGPSLDGVEGCRGVSSWSSWHGVSRCRVSVEVWCRGVEARAQEAVGRVVASAISVNSASTPFLGGVALAASILGR